MLRSFGSDKNLTPIFTVNQHNGNVVACLHVYMHIYICIYVLYDPIGYNCLFVIYGVPYFGMALMET